MSDLIGSVNIAVATASANAVIANASDDGKVTVMIVSSTNCFWNSGKTAVTATSADKYLPAQTPLIFRLPKGHDNLGAIRDTVDGTLTIYTLG